MNSFFRFFAILISLALTSAFEVIAQPVWVKETPAVASTGPLSITLNYGIDRTGTVYIIVYNYNNTMVYSSSTVKSLAQTGPSGSRVATAVISVTSGNINKILQRVLNVKDPNQVHTIYIVAQDSKRVLQASPVRLNATTLPCPPANAGPGGTECDRNFVLGAVPVQGTGIWSRVSGPGTASFSPSASTPAATVTVSVYGTYIFRWTETLGVCVSSDTITVRFLQMPSANAGSGGDACGNEFNLQAVTGSADIMGEWSMTSGTGTATFLPDPYTPNARVRVSEYGTKVFTWTLSNGPCVNSSSVTVNFYEQPVANPGTGGNNCGLEFYFNAVRSVEGSTGTWSRVSGPGSARYTPDSHDPMARVTVTAYGTYVFRWREVNGPCSGSATITVGFYEQVSANAGNGGDECDLTFALNAVPGSGTGTWSLASGPGTATFTPNPNQYNATVTVSQTGAYDFAWTEVNNNCTSTDIIRVVFHETPAVNAGQDVSICRGSGIRLQATGTGTFSWSPANYLDNPDIPNPMATPPVTTVYTVTLTDQWKCTNTDRVIVDVKERPVVNAGPDQDLDFLFETELIATPLNANETGEWEILTGTGIFSDRNSSRTTISDLSMGENSVLWSVTNGICAAVSDTVKINVRELIVPTLITPNLDGANDFFVIMGLESLGRADLRVFNRWGAVVYSNDNYMNDWDGKDNKGNQLPEDTYYYVLKPEKITAVKGYLVIKY